MTRQYQHEATLKEWANEIAAYMWVRPEKGHPKYTEGDFMKKPTKRQRETLFSVAYGALLSLNWGEDTRRDDEKGNAKAQAIIDCAEFTADLLFGNLLPCAPSARMCAWFKATQGNRPTGQKIKGAKQNGIRKQSVYYRT